MFTPSEKGICLMKRQLEIAVAQVKAKQTWACLLSTNGKIAW